VKFAWLCTVKFWFTGRGLCAYETKQVIDVLFASRHKFCYGSIVHVHHQINAVKRVNVGFLGKLLSLYSSLSHNHRAGTVCGSFSIFALFVGDAVFALRLIRCGLAIQDYGFIHVVSVQPRICSQKAYEPFRSMRHNLWQQKTVFIRL
jgi:hypothetical protein